MLTLDYQEENAKSAHLELLYHLQGRDNPDHPMHCLFTGLYQEYLEYLGLSLERPHTDSVQTLEY